MPPLDIAEITHAAVSPSGMAMNTGSSGQKAFDVLSRREWLCANGSGSFSSGTIAGANERRYHALLIAALDPPVRRMTLLSKIDETVTVGASRWDLSANRYPNGTVYPDGWKYLTEFSTLPVATWTFRLPGSNGSGDTVLVKRVYMARGRNTVYVTYTLREAPGVATLNLNPLVCWKDYHAEMRPWTGFPLRQGAEVGGWSLQATPDAPPLHLRLRGAQWSPAGWWHQRVVHDRERERGLDCEEDLYCPATAAVTLRVGQTVAFTGSIEAGEPDDATVILAEVIKRQEALRAQAAAAGKGAAGDEETWRELLRSADRFVVGTTTGFGGTAAAARTTILAGYPWFTDWGRDTMIALPGLCLATGRHAEARDILRAFAGFVSGGMVPNRFPDSGSALGDGDYNTADGTLWFVHACARYVEATGDALFQAEITPVLAAIVAAHQSGTRYGIQVDPEDGLLLAGGENTNLTWMDARVNGAAVTPRAGKPVEINALWIGALRTLAHWQGEGDGDAAHADADRAADSFRAKFVRPDGLGLYDFIAPDGTPDAAVRPNQVIAASLPDCPLSQSELHAVLQVANSDLLTPFGLRSLSPRDSRYQPHYGGDSAARDGAYHQGTVWAWLIGPYVDLYRRVHGAHADTRPLLAGLENHLRDYGVGGVAEIFDGDAPHDPNGCPWQAWSLAELIRVR